MLPIIRKRLLPEFVDGFFGRDMMDDFFNIHTGANVPAVNIVETNDDFKIEVAAPGLEKKDFNIDIDHDILTISSEKKEEKKEEDKKVMRREFCYTSFKRSFTLPDSVEDDKISASYKDGVLTVAVPKKEFAKEKEARQIKIS